MPDFFRRPGSQRIRDPHHRSRGQSVVELALILPVLLLLVVIALDFGRLFLGWIALNNMARVGADFAATHPDADWTSSTDSDVLEYRQLIASNADVINCTLRQAPPPGPAEAPPNPTYDLTREVGDTVRVSLDCWFKVLTPVVETVTGSWVKMSASSAYPITYGCLADCPPAGPPATPPPTANNCRDVPNMRDLSVAGARLAWVAAGFSLANFDPLNGDDTRTVDSQSIDPPDGAEACPSGEAYFASSVTVGLVDLIEPKPTDTCEYVPDMRGMAVADARTLWLASPLAGLFDPSLSSDDQIVLTQTTTPASRSRRLLGAHRGRSGDTRRSASASASSALPGSQLRKHAVG